MYNKKKSAGFLVCLIILNFATVSFAKGNAIVSIGKDLTVEQRVGILNMLGADETDEIIEVTNEEEIKYLGAYVDKKLLGSRAISSSYVEQLKKGKGIVVETHNITWVTEDMLINALVTAGVKDAKVVVGAPFKVSGTAALTGIIKGFENVSGETISEIGKQVASEEIATMGELGDSIGKDESAEIIRRVKEEVVKRNLNDIDEIKKVVEEASKEINITLTEDQKQQISMLMEKIANLDLNVDEIKSQLKNISDKLQELGKHKEEVISWLTKIGNFVEKIFDKLSQLIK